MPSTYASQVFKYENDSKPSIIPPKVNVFKCPERDSLIFRVVSKDGSFSDFQFDSRTQKMIRPLRIVREKDLFPKYYVFNERIQKYIMFVYNRVTNEHEQYVYRWETKQLEQVNVPDHFYRSEHDAPQFRMRSKVNNETVDIVRANDGSIEKVTSNGKKLLATPVKTLVDYDEQDGYIRSLPKYKINFCRLHEKNVVYARFKNGFRKFAFNEEKKQLEEFKCIECSSITDDDIYPQYIQHSYSLNGPVIVAWNSETELIEQYIYNVSMEHFKQVEDEGIVYDPRMEKERIGGILYTEYDGDSDVGPMIGEDGTLKRREYSDELEKFVEVSETPIITIRDEEEDKKMMEEEKKKWDEMEDGDDSSGFGDDGEELEMIEDTNRLMTDEMILEENYRNMGAYLLKLLDD